MRRLPILLAAALCIPAATADGRGYDVATKEQTIPLRDGVRVWSCMVTPAPRRPGERFPALYITDPYYGDCSRPEYRAFARAGYGVAYVHVRGTGRSEGVFPPREYSERELRDAVEIIGWLSRQPWSTGKVGMFGASWSGFNALQVAMRKPPALKAIVPYVATEDIYHEDGRYADGIFRFDEYAIIADTMLVGGGPGDPLDEQTLRNRFDREPYSLVYLRHQRDGGFWRRKIRLDRNPGALRVPTLMIGGLYDGYRSSIPRALEHLRVPAKAVVGPWNHEITTPGPTAAHVAVGIRWWDRWLKGKRNGVVQEPQLHVYMRRSHRPNPKLGAVPGEWRAIDRWPPKRLERRRLYFGADHEVRRSPTRPGRHGLRYVPASGTEAGIWWGDPMPDQRPADANSLVYESEPVRAETNLLGRPTAVLRVSASAPHADWMVRLEDVAPDGTTTLITGAGINPRRRTPGRTYRLEIPLHFTSWIFEPGHRIRVAVSNALWPMFWPTPFPMTTRLELGDARIGLPLVPPQSARAARRAARTVGSVNLTRKRASRVPDNEAFWIGPAHIERDVLNGTTTVSYASDEARVEYRTSDRDPAHSSVTATSSVELPYGQDKLEWRGQTDIASDRAAFHYRHRRQLLRNGEVIRERTWEATVPRDFQ